jgi:type II secretory pathway pseudopilin PulG
MVELMIAMAITAFITIAIYVSFASQQKTQVREQLVVEMQQNARAALMLMEQEIRAAGNDPTTVWGIDGVDNDGDGSIDEADEDENDRTADGMNNDCDGNADAPNVNADGVDEAFGIKKALAHEILFSMDLNGDRDVCDSGEYVRYAFADTWDADGDGWADLTPGDPSHDGASPFGRATGIGGAPQPFAENIEAVAFAYAFDDDADNQLDVIPATTDIIWAFDSDDNGDLDTIVYDDGSTEPVTNHLAANVPLSSIRSVRIWLLARTRAPIRDYDDTATYVVGNLVIDARDSNRDGNPLGDAPNGYKRRLLTTTVLCRNLGL